MSAVDELRALDKCCGAYRRLITGRKPPMDQQPPELAEAQDQGTRQPSQPAQQLRSGDSG